MKTELTKWVVSFRGNKWLVKPALVGGYSLTDIKSHATVFNSKREAEAAAEKYCKKHPGSLYFISCA
jgi:hypothetical protein